MLVCHIYSILSNNEESLALSEEAAAAAAAVCVCVWGAPAVVMIEKNGSIE